MVRTEFLNGAQEIRTPDEAKQFKKVYDILAENPEVVTKFLVNRMLRSTKHYDRIEFLTKGKLFIKILRMMVG